MNLWRLLGLCGALLFASRWLVQAHFARRAQAPVVTPLFWLITLGGSLTLVVYFGAGPAQDPVGVLSNGVPLFTAIYNLRLAFRGRNGDLKSPPHVPASAQRS